MGKRTIYTPHSKIKAALRLLTLRSRERALAMKTANYTCAVCGKKQSKAVGRVVVVEAHHKRGILNWDEVYKVIYKYLLPPAHDWECLCKSCHTLKEKLP
jgi:predicted HNH restriction endonuclease